MATEIPSNAVCFELGEIASIVGGKLFGDGKLRVRGICTDSRRDLRGQLFVALKGERFDGNAYVPAAIEQGAVAVLGQQLGPGVAGVEVDDSLAALGALARAHRQRWGGRVVAVAGSAGKTTTRTLIGALLTQQLGASVHLTQGNLNNLIGVPMVLFGVGEDHDVAVLELGTNQTGEIPTLADMTSPDVCVLTLIELEHSEGLGDLDAIEREEAAILRTGAALHVGNVDDTRVARQLLLSVAKEKLGVGASPEADYRIVDVTLMSDCRSRVTVCRPDGTELVFSSPFLGRPGALAVCTALAVSEHLGNSPIDARTLESALSRPDARQPGRLTPFTMDDGTLVIDDTYNANPASVRAAIDVAREVALLRKARLHLVLGEMRELGEWSASEHEKLSGYVSAANAATTTAIGGDAIRMLSRAPSHRFFETSAQAAGPVSQGISPGDVVLVKASRGVRAELVVDALLRREGMPE